MYSRCCRFFKTIRRERGRGSSSSVRIDREMRTAKIFSTKSEQPACVCVYIYWFWYCVRCARAHHSESELSGSNASSGTMKWIFFLLLCFILHCACTLWPPLSVFDSLPRSSFGRTLSLSTSRSVFSLLSSRSHRVDFLSVLHRPFFVRCSYGRASNASKLVFVQVDPRWRSEHGNTGKKAAGKRKTIYRSETAEIERRTNEAQNTILMRHREKIVPRKSNSKEIRHCVVVVVVHDVIAANGSGKMFLIECRAVMRFHMPSPPSKSI